MCIKYIILLCLIYNTPKVNSAGNETTELENYKTIEEWSSDLELATDINWAELMTADMIYENCPVEAALKESKCPPDILKGLLENSHEKKWPHGLSSPYHRFSNRLTMDKYKCRRVPGVNAVIMLHFENPRIPKTLKAKPGLLFFFEKIEITEGSSSKS